MLSLISDTLRTAADRRRAANHQRHVDDWADRFVSRSRAEQRDRKLMNQRNLW